jgi:hypothetical protein
MGSQSINPDPDLITHPARPHHATWQASLFKPTDPVAPARIPEQKVFNGVEFPLVLEPNPHPVEGVTCRRPDGRCQIDALDEALDGWVEANHHLIDQLLLKVRPSVRP